MLGMLANEHERRLFRQSPKDWRLCPVLFSLPYILVVMRRAAPVPKDFWADPADPEYDVKAIDEIHRYCGCVQDPTGGFGEPTMPCDPSFYNFGVVDGRVVAIDYGLYVEDFTR